MVTKVIKAALQPPKHQRFAMVEPPNSSIPFLETTRTKPPYQFEANTSKSLHPKQITTKCDKQPQDLAFLPDPHDPRRQTPSTNLNGTRLQARSLKLDEPGFLSGISNREDPNNTSGIDHTPDTEAASSTA
ncbi:hypothetical protein COLO4_16128 [Corchorus olitorius]|uniref:Uncharacterized protein n=1 Tax=Corchorus olitorius TaxID=93759 RepID=A0A1R3JJC1_9ROSI|nr:hypothetical protein COLO4_16128 [Corchorus olitorius]